MSVSLNRSIASGPSASVPSSGSSSSVQQIRSQQQELMGQQQAIQQQMQSGQISQEQGQNKILDLQNKIRDLDNKVLDANNKAASDAQNGGGQAAPPVAAPVGFSGASSFEPAPTSRPKVVLDPTLNKSGGGSKPGASGGIGQ